MFHHITVKVELGGWEPGIGMLEEYLNKILKNISFSKHKKSELNKTNNI